MTQLSQKLAGKFIVLDGPDGSGKSTQLKMLAEHLQAAGLRVRRTRDPGGTPIGDKIRHILLDRANTDMVIPCEILLYMASRAQLAGEIISPALANNECVLCDRWVSSTVAYQVASGAATGEDIMALYRMVLKDLRQDLTIILDVDPQVGLARASAGGPHDRIEARDADFHSRVRELFLKQARDQPERFVVIDAAAEIAGVHEQIVQTIENHRFEATNNK